MPGQVKTRLAKTTGPARALEIYERLLRHTNTITQVLDCDKWVFYADEIIKDDRWDNKTYCKALQQGKDLGERMRHAFQTLFEKGYSSVVIIGSDCMELSSSIIEGAFARLSRQEVYIGPSADGGYYLLGLTAMHNRLFQDISWSTDKVLLQTEERCRESGLQILHGPILHDIDDEEDWKNYLRTRAASSTLVFVYNADSDLFSTLTDYVHKLLSPATYACSLCALTHHHAGMRKAWKDFVASLPCKTLFLHKDQFGKLYPVYKETGLPAIFLAGKNQLRLLLPAAMLNELRTLEELIHALQTHLQQHDLDHYTSV